VTDDSWRSGQSPILSASLYHGETYDARQEEAGWCLAGFDDSRWGGVTLRPWPKAKLQANTMPPVRVTETLRPVSIKEPRKGVFVADFGQNFAGWVRIRAEGPAGTRIVLKHAERAHANGMIDPWSNRGARSTDTFILSGKGVETYEPQFTYHGFRYAEIIGFPGRPTTNDVMGCVVHADVQDRAGRFRTSNALINRIHHNCVWSMRSNLMSIPTDNPVRNERTPCQMDSRVYEEAAIHNFRMNRYYVKWLDDIAGTRGLPDWGGDGPLLVWHLYRYYGDRRTLEAQYDHMRGFVDALHTQHPEHILTKGYGDWCAPGDGTYQGSFHDATEVNTALYAHIARTVAKAADALGKPDDAKKYAALADEIGAAFHRRLHREDTATYGDGSQTTSLLPLAFDIVPADKRVAVFDRLVRTIEGSDKGHLNTGITGTRYLVDVLCEYGRPDLALSILTKTTSPSFGWQIADGATTTWEQWHFRGGMHTFNHAMFAGIDASFYTHLAGIEPLEPGYAKIRIRPFFPPQLDCVEAETPTVKGPVGVHWERKAKGAIELTVRVPVNAEAWIHLPTTDPKAVRESGRPAEAAPGVVLAGTEPSRAVYRVGSGTYRFSFSTEPGA
jgi:alpha-L-rhamnosidase